MTINFNLTVRKSKNSKLRFFYANNGKMHEYVSIVSCNTYRKEQHHAGEFNFFNNKKSISNKFVYFKRGFFHVPVLIWIVDVFSYRSSMAAPSNGSVLEYICVNCMEQKANLINQYLYCVNRQTHICYSNNISLIFFYIQSISLEYEIIYDAWRSVSFSLFVCVSVCPIPDDTTEKY